MAIKVQLLQNPLYFCRFQRNSSHCTYYMIRIINLLFHFQSLNLPEYGTYIYIFSQLQLSNIFSYMICKNLVKSIQNRLFCIKKIGSKPKISLLTPVNFTGTVPNSSRALERRFKSIIQLLKSHIKTNIQQWPKLREIFL